MKLLTKAIEAKLKKAPLYSTEKQDVTPVIVKFFNPTGNWTWYVLEGEQDETNGDWTFFGLVEGHEKELGYFSLGELAAYKGRFGLGIERDLWFENYVVDKTTKEVKQGVRA